VTSSTPGTALMASSIGRDINSSISSGLAFSYVVEILMVGKVISGIKSMGSRVRETMPRIIMIRKTMVVRTGR
jgi:hypothetical protein